ncbi:hypothetical protein QVD99_003059 [Batrachochytrium dendrobatidis]|nr:hypothetical protein O5D80_001781 [Batrachochytrium dendrobatidis]KAK5670367.1 hypothetical protein QVD99_003059 [Batrachochytrium dendrobatidis]
MKHLAFIISSLLIGKACALPIFHSNNESAHLEKRQVVFKPRGFISIPGESIQRVRN